MKALELEGPDSPPLMNEWEPDRSDDVMMSVEINGTRVRLLRESWSKPDGGTGLRYWIYVDSAGVLTPVQAIAFARACSRISRRAADLEEAEEDKRP